jgi:WD40 repeat protein
VSTATSPSPKSWDAPQQDLPECPYIGLVSFDEKNAAYFFGRERESDLIVANLTASRLTLLYAPSGVGKTSVLRAGVVRRFQQIDDDNYDDPGVSHAAVAYVSAWRDSPLERIAAAVLDAVSRALGAEPVQQVASDPKLSVDWLFEVLRESRVSSIYLILDQFEEYLLYYPTDRGEEGLTAELAKILSTRDLPVHVLLAIREDALASLDRFKGRVPRLFGNYLRLAHLSRDAARAAIEGPLDRYNRIAPPDQTMSIEPGLTATVLDQVRTGQVQMVTDDPAPDAPEGRAVGRSASDHGDIETPYLQLVLTRLWDQERATGSSSLRRSTLHNLGGAQTIVQTHLDNIMAGLSPAQVDVAAALFRYLITPSGTKIALATADLADLTGLAASTVQDLLDTLSSGSQRILRSVPPAVGVAGPPRYEIFHDVVGAAVIDWRRRYVVKRRQEEASRQREEESRQLIAEREEARATAQIARRQLRHTRFTVGLAVLLLLIIGLFAAYTTADAQQQRNLAQAATTLSYNPVQSLRHAVDAYQVKAPWLRNKARSAVLTAAASPRGHLVAGPNHMTGMAVTPDFRHVVAYDTNGSVRVIGDNGTIEHDTMASGLRGTVTPVASTNTNALVSAAAVSPDASRVALGTDQGTVAVIDTATGRHADIDAQAGSPLAIGSVGDATPAVVRWIGSAANGLVLVVTRSGAAATYDPETGAKVASFPDVIDALSLADEQHIVTSGKDRKLRVWDARNGTESAESSALNPAAYVLRRYAQSVVSLSVDATPSIVVWNWQAESSPVRYPVEDLNGVRQVVVNEHAQIVLTSQDKKVRMYSLVDGAMPRSLPQEAGFVNNVALSPDGQWITTAGADGRVLVWSLRHGQSPTAPTYEFFGHQGEVTQVSYLDGGKVVMSLGADGTVRRWELPRVPRFEQHDSRVVHMDLSRDGSWLATTGQDGRAYVIDPHDLTKPPVATVAAGAPLRVALFDPTNPHHILTLEQSDRVPKLWSWSGAGEPKRAPTKYQPPPQLPAFGYLVSLAISPDGKTVASGDTGGNIHLWDAMTGALRTDREFPGTGQPAESVAFDPTGQLLAMTHSDGVRLWRLSTTEPPMVLPHPRAISVTFDPSGEHLVSAERNGTLRVWTRDGKRDHELLAHGYLASSPSFSADGGLLAVGTADGLVEAWDVHSGAAVLLDRHHSGSVNSVVFLPGDRSGLISASDDTTVARFSCPACTDSDRVIREALEWAKSNP